MNKYSIITKTVIVSVMLLLLSGCEDFLNRPTEDNYTVDSFYQTDEQCFQAVNPVYNSPWYDFQRGFFKVGEVLSGNYYWGSSPYLTFTINSTDEDLTNMSASLWSVNAYCNGIIENIDMKAGPGVSEYAKNTVKGEALVWKAMTYFYLVRTFGAVPIIHNNSAMISAGDYNQIFKATIPNVYDYIIMTLEKAIEWLPESNDPGRIDRYSAYGLLAKVYLTKAGYGMSGSRNQDDLDKAAEYAGKVIDESGRNLLPVYSDVFRLKNNYSEESLLAWHWVVSNQWTSQNSLQSDLGIQGIDEYGATWGGYGGPSVDLQDAFGENALSLTRNNVDTRRKATMMMYGDMYDYFWVDKGGLDYTAFAVESMEYQSPGCQRGEAYRRQRQRPSDRYRARDGSHGHQPQHSPAASFRCLPDLCRSSAWQQRFHLRCESTQGVQRCAGTLCAGLRSQNLHHLAGYLEGTPPGAGLRG